MHQDKYVSLGAMVSLRLAKQTRDFDDISQNTVLRLLRKPKSKLTRSFAFTAAQFELKSAYRSDSRYRFHLRRATRERTEIDENNEIEIAIASMDARLLVDHAFARLKKSDVDVLRRHLMEDKEFSDIAKEDGVALDTVKRRFYRAKHRCLEILERFADQ